MPQNASERRPPSLDSEIGSPFSRIGHRLSASSLDRGNQTSSKQGAPPKANDFRHRDDGSLEAVPDGIVFGDAFCSNDTAHLEFEILGDRSNGQLIGRFANAENAPVASRSRDSERTVLDPVFQKQIDAVGNVDFPPLSSPVENGSGSDGGRSLPYQ